MKHLKLLLPFLFILLIGCSSDDSTSKTTATTRLELTTLDENDVAVENVEVKLYTSQTDYDNDTNVVETLLSDVNGKVTFDNLQPITYFWKTSIDCYLENNLNNNTVNPILENSLNQFSTNLTDNSLGHIYFGNFTTYDYTVNFTGPQNFGLIVTPDIFQSVNFFPAGVYTFTISPNSGPNPTYTQIETLECGGTIEIEIHD